MNPDLHGARARFVVVVSGWLLALLALLPVPVHAAHLEFVAEVPGTVQDMNWQRILYMTYEDGQNRLKVMNRINGTVRTIPGAEPSRGWLTAHGVLFSTAANFQLYEWSAGSTPSLVEGFVAGYNESVQLSPVTRRYGIWPRFVPETGVRLVRRDFVRGTTTVLGNDTVVTEPNAGISDYGVVAYSQAPSPYNIFRYRDGNTTQLTTDGPNMNPLTDGIRVVYRNTTPAGRFRIVMHSDATGEIVLAPPTALTENYYRANSAYAVSSGWVAFTRIAYFELAPYRQVWLRSPDGVLSHVSAFESDNYINAMHKNEVMFVNSNYLFLGRPDEAPVLIAPFAAGTQSFWLTDGWYVRYSGQLYKVVL